MLVLNADSQNHYVYLLQSKDESKNYIGVRSCKCPIGKDNYRGSSRSMTKEEKENCNKIILRRFSTREEAVAYEIELHNTFNVGANPLFWNNAKQTAVGFDRSGTTISEEHKAAITSYGKSERNVAHLKAVSESRRGKKIQRSVVDKIIATKLANPPSQAVAENARKLGLTGQIKVLCVTNGVIYNSGADAARELGIGKSYISQACRGLIKNPNKHGRFEFYTKEK